MHAAPQRATRRTPVFMPSQLPIVILLFCFNLLVARLYCCSCGRGSHAWVSTFQKSLLLETTCTQAQRNLVIGCLIALSLLHFLCDFCNIHTWEFWKGWLTRGFCYYCISEFGLLRLADRKGWVYWHSTVNLTLSSTFIFALRCSHHEIFHSALSSFNMQSYTA